MTFISSITLFFSMIVLALIPGPGVFIVVTRSTAAGFRQGISTTAGVIAGDFFYITVALLGLTALSEWMGIFFSLFKYVGSLYLVVLGLSLLRNGPQRKSTVTKAASSHFASFSLGLITTLGNPKAILFYLSFLPAFLDLSQVTFQDAVILYIIATLSVGSIMLGYAYTATKLHHLHSKTSDKVPALPGIFRYASCMMLIMSGIYIAVRG